MYENLCSKIHSFVNVFFCSGHWKLEINTFPAISYDLTGVENRTLPIGGNDRTWAAETQLVEEELNQTPRSIFTNLLAL